jgi:hypothetical protein
MVPFQEPETTLDYIQRVVALIVRQLNLHALDKLFQALSFSTILDVVIEKDKIQLMVGNFTPDSTTATIQGGSLIDCGIPLITSYQPNLALMSQLLKIIEQAPTDTVYVRIVATQNGFVGLHKHQDYRRDKFIFLSNNQGVSIVIKGIRLFDMENFLKKPTNELVVIHPTSAPFFGVIGHIELSTAAFAIIRVGEERYSIPTRQWSFLQNFIEMF